jgi:hypothetical protein
LNTVIASNTARTTDSDDELDSELDEDFKQSDEKIKAFQRMLLMDIRDTVWGQERRIKHLHRSVERMGVTLDTSVDHLPSPIRAPPGDHVGQEVLKRLIRLETKIMDTHDEIILGLKAMAFRQTFGDVAIRRPAAPRIRVPRFTIDP